MKKMMMVFVVLFAMVGSSFGETASGKITNITSFELGFAIQLNNIPQWFVVKNEYKAMTAMAMHAWMNDFIVDVSFVQDGGNHIFLDSLDPQEK